MKLSENEFNYVYNEYSKHIYNIAYGYTRNKDDATDIMQNCFLKLLSCNKHFNSNEDIKYFMIRVCINECLDLLKSSHKKKVINSNDFISNYSDNFDDKSDSVLLTKIAESVNLLKEKYKKVIILYYYDQMNVKSIANTLNISESAVKKRLERARKIMKELIERR